MVLIDNNPVSFLTQPSNGIPVRSFYDDPLDDDLTVRFLSIGHPTHSLTHPPTPPN